MRQIEMKDLTEQEIKSMVPSIPLTGECELDIDAITKLWNEYFFISQWNDVYRLGSYQGFKVTISKRQAIELIVQLDLDCQQSDIFRSGRSWISKPQ